MTTSEALLAAVLARPEDDLPRLVYADYLEENGESERAEFIRASIADPHGGQYTASQHIVAEFRPHAGDVSKLPADSMVRVRRGFVAEITCTLSQWCGGRCPTCDGWAFDTIHDERTGRTDHVNCTACNGTGRTIGIGPAVVRSHPVEVVRVTDREPEMPRTDSSMFIGWIRYGEDAEPQDRPDVIPADVYDLLEGGSKQWDYLRWMKYPTAEDANAALSAALIAWAKSQPHPHAAENAELDAMMDDALTSPSYD